jgi:4-cresol dehydrogenase (hydroxylating)
VTQRQLLDYIEEKKLPLMLNVTGSTSDTSLIGNAMDRGVGYFDSRAHGISAMQIVLGSGKTIQTGFRHYDNSSTAFLYPYGIGPSLDGLFQQGSFGIVVSACIDLIPKPDDHMAAIIRIDSEDKLKQLINGLASLRSRGIITTVAHVGNRERSCITLAPLLYEQLVASGETGGETARAKALRILENGGFGPWSAAIGLLGTREQLALARREIKKTLGAFAKTMFLTDPLIAKANKIAGRLSFIPAIKSQLMLLKAVAPVYGFTAGRATDQSIKSVYWAAGDLEHLNAADPDHSNSGILFCLPIIPADGQTVEDVVRVTHETFRRHGFEAAITLNLMTAKAMEGVVSLAFDRRDPEQTAKAHACIQEMEARYMELGCPPYRVGINSMHHVVREEDSFWQTVRELKQALDPNHIIAPGRYSLV